MKDRGQWKKIGVIGVDAGICWIGDPCYILHQEEIPKDIGKNWTEFCNRTDTPDNHWQFNYDAGHPGLGVCVSTGWGDGEYKVFAREENGRIAEVKVVFGYSDDEEEE